MRSRSQQQQHAQSPENDTHDNNRAATGYHYSQAHVSRTPVSPSGPRIEYAHRGKLHHHYRLNGISAQVTSPNLDNDDDNGVLPNQSHMQTSSNGGGAYPSYSSTLDGTGSIRPLPGRARRKRPGRRSKYDHHASSSSRQSFSKRCYARWIKGFTSSFGKLFVAVALWYGLGVVSIASSKLLLTQYAAAVPPLCLTLQQLLIGSTLLRFLLHVHFLQSPGLQPCPTETAPRHSARRWSYVSPPTRSFSQSTVTQILEQITGGAVTVMHPQLLAAGVFFSLGFLATNYAFSASAASFVETIKASEPISSALLAYLWRIEILGSQELSSLGTIVVGVVFSTLGNGHSSSKSAVANSFQESLYTCMIVFIANFCFSFRGLYQKLFRAGGMVLDDLNLQFRMQQVGVCLLVLPALLREGPSVLSYWWHHRGSHDGSFFHFLILSILNGLCFTGYNLASTYILSRISVVHHAALNCLRRVFAIVCTSIYFQVPLSWLGMFGIALSTAGFLSFTHYKVQRQRRPQPVSSLLPVSLSQSSPSG